MTDIKNFLSELRQIGPVSKVWTEKEMIDVAAKEFEEVEKIFNLINFYFHFFT